MYKLYITKCLNLERQWLKFSQNQYHFDQMPKLCIRIPTNVQTSYLPLHQ